MKFNSLSVYKAVEKHGLAKSRKLFLLGGGASCVAAQCSAHQRPQRMILTKSLTSHHT